MDFLCVAILLHKGRPKTGKAEDFFEIRLTIAVENGIITRVWEKFQRISGKDMNASALI